MDEKINIAKILKNKPEGTKLWTDMFGSVTLYVVTDVCDAFQVKHHNKEPWFDKDGTLYKEGVLCIYPSKSMRDWEKFSWKKGDVLVYRNCEEFYYTIFEGFQDDEYTQFKSRYCNNSENRWLQSKVGITDLFTKVSDEEAKRFIKKIEECYNGKLDLDTLEIEKAQPEFKNGDIVIQGVLKGVNVCIIKNCIDKIDNKYNYYARYNTQDKEINYDDWSYISPFAKFATDSEKQQLFEALAKEGKHWDAEKKMIVDLPKKCEFKAMDWCLMRDHCDNRWELCQFGFYLSEEDSEEGVDYYPYCAVGGHWFHDCIPYNDQTKHLLGTTDERKGGEG